MAEDRASCHRSRIREPLLKPDLRVLETFHKEVAQDGMELVTDTAVHLDTLVNGLGLRIGDELAAVVGLEVFGEVPLMCG